jgi:Flp pilus assembly pilin Flp
MLSKLFVRVLAWFQGEEGQDLIEYALITTGLSVAIIVAIVAGGIPGAFTDWAADIVGRI